MIAAANKKKKETVGIVQYQSQKPGGQTYKHSPTKF